MPDKTNPVFTTVMPSLFDDPVSSVIASIGVAGRLGDTVSICKLGKTKALPILPAMSTM